MQCVWYLPNTNISRLCNFKNTLDRAKNFSTILTVKKFWKEIEAVKEMKKESRISTESEKLGKKDELKIRKIYEQKLLY